MAGVVMVVADQMPEMLFEFVAAVVTYEHFFIKHNVLMQLRFSMLVFTNYTLARAFARAKAEG